MLRAVIDHMLRDVEQLLPEGNVPFPYESEVMQFPP